MSNETKELYLAAKDVSGMFPDDMGDDGTSGWGWTNESENKVKRLRKALNDIDPLIKKGGK